MAQLLYFPYRDNERSPAMSHGKPGGYLRPPNSQTNYRRFSAEYINQLIRGEG